MTPPKPQREPTICFQDASYGYDGPRGNSIVSKANVEVSQGETVVLLGRSGSGKTTLLKLINRLLVPTGGQVRVQGKATTEWNPIQLRRKIGYVIQETGLFPHFTIAENVGLVPGLEGWEAGRIEARVREMMELVGLPAEQYADRKPHELSGGQRQRVGVARALAADPPILLMDEPFGALDPITRTELQAEFGRIFKELGKTTVFVTHDLREALLLGTRVMLLEKGKIVADAPPKEFLTVDEPEVKAFAAVLGPAT